MTPEEKKQMVELEKRVKQLESILTGFASNKTHTDKMRGIIVDGEHTAGKPTIIGKNGKRYNLQTV